MITYFTYLNRLPNTNNSQVIHVGKFVQSNGAFFVKFNEHQLLPRLFDKTFEIKNQIFNDFITLFFMITGIDVSCKTLLNFIANVQDISLMLKQHANEVKKNATFEAYLKLFTELMLQTDIHVQLEDSEEAAEKAGSAVGLVREIVAADDEEPTAAAAPPPPEQEEAEEEEADEFPDLTEITYNISAPIQQQQQDIEMQEAERIIDETILTEAERAALPEDMEVDLDFDPYEVEDDDDRF